MIPINEQVGLFNWAIDFTENPSEGFLVDIYCDNQKDFHKIISIVTSAYKEIEFLFWNKGPIDMKVAA